jgi:ABC-type branched-subunit amino acid transport system ATPase component
MLQTELMGPDIARAIRATLCGELTKPQLGQWAFKAMLNADAGAIPYEWRRRVELSKAILELMVLDEKVAPDEYFGIEDSEHQALANRLEQLAQPANPSFPS